MPEALPLLPLLAEWAGYFIAFGICLLALQIVRALFGTADSVVGWIPWLGSKIKGPLHSIEQKLTNELGAAVAALDHRMALTWYKMAHLAEWIGNEIKANAGLLAVLANLIANPNSIAAWRQAINGAHTAIKGVESSIGGKVHALTHPISGELTALEKYIGGKVRVYDKAIERTIPKDIAGLRARTKALEKHWADYFKLLKRLDARFATKAFAGTVALALVYMGLGWVRCNSFKSFGKRLGCKGWGLLDDLLAGVIDVLVIADLCQLTKLLIDVAESAEVQTVISGIIEGMDELLLCQGVKRPPALSGYWTDPPPAQPFAALPAV